MACAPDSFLKANVMTEINDENIDIKLENDGLIETEEHGLNLKDKSDEANERKPSLHFRIEPSIIEPSSSFVNKDSVLQSLVENIEMEIKQEMEALHNNSEADFLREPSDIDRTEQLEIKEENTVESDDNTHLISKPESTELILKEENEELIEDSNSNKDFKEELEPENNSIVSYDFPQFDSESVDSNDESAYGHIDNSLLEEIKSKKRRHYDPIRDKKDFESCDVKQESNLVTETHLISNKLINTLSTISYPQKGIIESQTTQTLIMEILPMQQVHLHSTDIGGYPEEILPTTDTSTEDFQLNSITGDVLPLEAYGLLNTSKKKEHKQKPEKLCCCPKCPKKFKNKYALKPHLKVHDSIERYATGRARAQQKRQEAKLKKEHDKNKMYKCTCEKRFRRRSQMEACLRSHNEVVDTISYTCITCSKEFKTKEDLTIHRKRLHSRKKFPCKFCPTDYDTRKELFKHLRKHQKVQLMEYQVISEVVEGKEKLKCLMCNKMYCDLTELKSHVMGDHKPPFKCPHCKENFTNIEDFATHIKTTHPKVKGQSMLNVLEAFSKLAEAWKCEECNLQFHQADELALHQAEKHSRDTSSEVEQFQCADCRRVFASAKSLNSHRRIHHKDSVKVEAAPIEQGLLCVYCRKVCKDENALTSHMRFHSSDRKYACKFCDFRFATVEKRKTHAEIHTGSMRYVCFICEYRCSSENRLKNHKASVKHMSMKDYLLTGKPLESLTSKEEKISQSLNDAEWKVKKRRVSEQIEPVQSSSGTTPCDVCGENFSNEKKMLEHKMTHPFIEFPNEDQPSRIFFK